MGRRGRQSKRRRAPVADWQARLLRTGEWPSQEDAAAHHESLGWKFFEPHAIETAWEARHAELLAAHIAEAPGRRPWAWWRFNAPAPRERVGGSGETWPAVSFDFGLPGRWAWNWIDDDDPPRYESEAAYLRRLGLLTDREARRLKAHDFEPVAIALPPSTLEA